MNIQEVLYMQKIAGIITEDEFIKGEFLQKADPAYGVDYVEKFHYIDENDSFSFLRNQEKYS